MMHSQEGVRKVFPNVSVEPLHRALEGPRSGARSRVLFTTVRERIARNPTFLVGFTGSSLSQGTAAMSSRL